MPPCMITVVYNDNYMITMPQCVTRKNVQVTHIPKFVIVEIFTKIVACLQETGKINPYLDLKVKNNYYPPFFSSIDVK